MAVRPTWISALVALLLTSFCCGCMAGQLDYDWSSPRAALVSRQRAFAAADPDGISAGAYAPGMTEEHIRARMPNGPVREYTTFDYLLNLLEPRQIDGKLFPELREEVERGTQGIDAAARVVSTVRSGPITVHRWPPELQHMAATYFVRQQGKWKWRGGPIHFFEHWSYDFRTPLGAFQAVLSAVTYHDVLTIYDMMDPQVLGGVDREQFQATALERLAAIDNWERGRLVRELARHQSQKPPPEQPRPFLPIRGSNGGKREVEEFTQDGKQCARVWQLSPADGKRVSSEEFVKLGEHWFWRPKPEYDVWPLPNRPGSALPPSTSKRCEYYTAGSGGVRINWSEVVTAMRTASRPASRPATATAAE